MTSEPSKTLSDLPAVRLWLAHRVDVEWLLPWVTIGAIVLVASAAAGSGPFNVALGLEGVALAVWAALIARKAARDSLRIEHAVVETRELSSQLTTSVEKLAVVTSSAATTAARLIAMEEVERLKSVLDAVGSKPLTFPGKSPPPFTLDQSKRREAYGRLSHALGEAEGLDLPASRDLRSALWPFPYLDRGARSRMENFDFADLHNAARQEVSVAIQSRRKVLREAASP